jgi:hypothetical protein
MVISLEAIKKFRFLEAVVFLDRILCPLMPEIRPV